MPSKPIANPNPDAEPEEEGFPTRAAIARALAMNAEERRPEPARAAPDVARAAIAAARVAIDRGRGAGSGVGRRPARRVLPADLRHELDDCEPF